MSYISPSSIPRLLQRFKLVQATGVTFLCLISLLASHPAAANLWFLDVTSVQGAASGTVSSDTAPAGPSDVLDKLRAGFSLSYEENSRTAAELKWFVKHPDYLNRVFTRAQRYMPYIAAELERRNMPLELALLPIVESAYDPFAYSHGRAAGLWQMIPGTARRFGIKQNWW
ncbi:MAG: transglycosylase SLT domain-containing protein, partial [Woeseiaceae bacterium]